MTSGFRLLTALSVALLAACAGQSSKPELSLDEQLQERGYSGKEEIDRISNYRLNGWNLLNQQAIIIRSSPRNHYLITLSRRCQELNSAITIGIDSDAGGVSRFNKLIVRSAPHMTRDCQIDSIYKLEKEKSA